MRCRGLKGVLYSQRGWGKGDGKGDGKGGRKCLSVHVEG